MTMKFKIEQFESKDIQSGLDRYWMSVSDQIQWINRLLFLEWASARVIAGWVPAASEFEAKCKLTYFMWQDMTIADRLRVRKEELAGNSKILIPSEKLLQFIQDSAAADGYHPFIAGWFLELQRAQIEEYEHLIEALDPIFDAPTLEILEEVLPKKRGQWAWAKQEIHNAVTSKSKLEEVERWRRYVRSYLLHLGGVCEREESLVDKPVAPIEKAYGPAPSKRSKPASLNTDIGLNDFPPEFKGTLKTFMWHYATEIQVIDPMCYAFYGMDDMPFEFYVDFSRHIWDESRHHQMGVRRLQQLGYEPGSYPLPYGEDAITDLEGYYLNLTMLGETCSFTRKKKSMDAYYEKGDIISGMTAEIDIVDERSHVRFGKKWLEPIFKQRRGDDRSLEEIVRGMIDNVLSDLPEAERKSISHFAFCGKIEFKDLNYDHL